MIRRMHDPFLEFEERRRKHKRGAVLVGGYWGMARPGCCASCDEAASHDDGDHMGPQFTAAPAAAAAPAAGST